MKLLIDNNVALDYLLDRENIFQYSSQIIESAFIQNHTLYLTASSLSDIFYVAQSFDSKFTKERFEFFTSFFNILDTTSKICSLAFQNPMTDFEDALQAESAKAYQLDYIITSNLKDFKHSPVPALDPEGFIEKYPFAKI